MRKLLLSMSLLTAGMSFAQVIHPNVIVPQGWVHPMTEDKIEKNIVTGEGAYMSSHANPGAQIDYSADGNSLKIEKSDVIGEFASVSFETFDASGEAAIQSTVNITSNPTVFLKIKGTVGTKVTINLKDNSFAALLDDWDSDNYNQTVVCEDYRWYKFDYSSNNNDLSSVRSIEIVINNGVSSAATISVDSLVLGETGITPMIPRPLSQLRWDLKKNVPWFTSADPNGIPVADNTLELDTGNFYKATIASTSANDKGAQFTINDGSNSTTIDMSENPFVRAMIKGTPGDSVRINVLNGSNFDWVDSYMVYEFLSDDFEEIIFDYSAVANELTEASLVEIILNPNSQTDGVFYVQELTVGNYLADGCGNAAPVGFIDDAYASKVIDAYPNPVTAGTLYFGEYLTDVAIYNIQGIEMMSEASADQMDVSNLEEGIYFVKAEEGVFKFIVE